MTVRSSARASNTVVHLVRHGEVHNPDRVLYGRLGGFGLTARGEADAAAVAARLAKRDVVRIVASPLERTRQTAAPLAVACSLPVVSDHRLVEASSVLEGRRVDMHRSMLLQPHLWSALWNPWRPSWGEPYRAVAARMWQAVTEVRAHARGHEAVLVSHQMPIWVTRRRAQGTRLAHHPRRRQCELASITSLSFLGDNVTHVEYWYPTADHARR